MRSKALLLLAAGLVRFVDAATVLLTALLAGGSDMRKQSPAPINMAALHRDTVNNKHGKSVMGK